MTAEESSKLCFQTTELKLICFVSDVVGRAPGWWQDWQQRFCTIIIIVHQKPGVQRLMQDFGLYVVTADTEHSWDRILGTFYYNSHRICGSVVQSQIIVLNPVA